MDAALVPPRLKIAAALAAVCAIAVAALVLLGGGGGSSDHAAATAASSPAAAEVPAVAPNPAPPAKPLKAHPKVVVAVPPGQAPPTEATNVPSNSRRRRTPRCAAS